MRLSSLRAIGRVQLRSDGLVVTVAGRGSYVADPPPDDED
jgi:hypothetical protein